MASAPIPTPASVAATAAAMKKLEPRHDAASDLSPYASTGDTITVGCSLPHGLVMELYQRHETNDADGKKQILQMETGEKVTLNGRNSSSMIFGYGITHGVSKDFWDAWTKANRNFPPLKAGAIFVCGGESEVLAATRDHSTVKTGFEPINPDLPGPKLEPVAV